MHEITTSPSDSRVRSEGMLDIHNKWAHFVSIYCVPGTSDLFHFILKQCHEMVLLLSTCQSGGYWRNERLNHIGSKTPGSDTISFEYWKDSSNSKTRSESEEHQTGYWGTNSEVIALEEPIFDEELNEGSVAYVLKRRKEKWQVLQSWNYGIWSCKRNQK